MTKGRPANSMQWLRSAGDGYFVEWHCWHFFTCTGRFHSFARWSGKAVQTGNTYFSCSVRICKTASAQDPRYGNSQLEWERKSEFEAFAFRNKNTIHQWFSSMKMKGCKNWSEKGKMGNLWGYHFIRTWKKEKWSIHKKVCQGKDLKDVTASKEIMLTLAKRYEIIKKGLNTKNKYY